MYTAGWTDWLERHFGNWAIPHLMRGIVILNALAFVLIGISPDFANALVLDPQAILRGEVWRLVTFIFIPGTSNIIFIIFYLLFTWFIGDALESEWGAFKLNLFYFTGMAALAVVAFVFVKGQVNHFYLHSSLLLAFGTVFPRYEIMLFPIPIPIQAKYLAWFDGFILAFTALQPYLGWVILASTINYILFFLPPFLGDQLFKFRQKKRMKPFDKGKD